MATKKTTQPRTPAVPQPGSRPSIRVDAQLSDDFATIMRAGGNATDAIRTAVEQLADMYRTAWAHGVIPDGQPAQLLAYQLGRLPTGAPTPTRPYDATSDRPSIPRVHRRIPGPYPVRQRSA
ncbi:hypothetical protein [Streptomyces sp. NPDC096323]|uniref:hypothetical protein n=1 Tax=Streptomyces sp. NPDC096323 TaxID=3155822 RepID=UPI00331F5E53